MPEPDRNSGFPILSGELSLRADSPAPVPPSDADLLDIEGPLRRTDPTHFRPRKQKKLEVYQHLSLESVDKAYQDAVQTAGI